MAHLSHSSVQTDDDSFASERDAQPTDDQVTTFVFNRNHSSSIRAQREALPIFQHRDQILYCLEHFQTLVLVGETGCGKSTQVPQVCAYLLGWLKKTYKQQQLCGAECVISDLFFLASLLWTVLVLVVSVCFVFFFFDLILYMHTFDANFSY